MTKIPDLPGIKSTVQGRECYFAATHREVEGRHVLVDQWKDCLTNEVLQEHVDQSRDLFSPEESLDERLICQEASSIYLGDGVVPTKMIIGSKDFKTMCESLYPKHRISLPPPLYDPDGKIQPNEIKAIVTTVGHVDIIEDTERPHFRQYLAKDGSVLRTVGDANAPT